MNPKKRDVFNYYERYCTAERLVERKHITAFVLCRNCIFSAKLLYYTGFPDSLAWNIIKQLSGEDAIPAEYKGGDVFSFYNTSKMLFSANTVPLVEDEYNLPVSSLQSAIFCSNRCSARPPPEEPYSLKKASLMYYCLWTWGGFGKSGK